MYLNSPFDYPGQLPVVVFNQNGYYSFGPINTPDYWKPTAVLNTYNDKRIIHVLCVSQSDHDLLTDGFCLNPQKVSCVRNGLEVDLCRPQGTKSRRMAAMPRKNQRDLAVVRAI